MNVLLHLFLVATGAVFGSFLGAVIERQSGLPGRLKKKASGLSSRSFCFRCGLQLTWWQNIPILSYLLLKGRCSHCHSPIPAWLLLIELTTAASFFIGLSLFGYSVIRLFGFLVLAAVLNWVFYADLVYGVVPDAAIMVGGLGGVLSHLGDLGSLSYLNYVVSALGVALFFLFLVAITRGRGMGTGDVTLGALVGFLLGWPRAAVALWLTFVVGALVGVFLIVMKKKTLKQTIPFGPFLVAATAVTPLVAPWLDRVLPFVVK